MARGRGRQMAPPWPGQAAKKCLSLGHSEEKSRSLVAPLLRMTTRYDDVILSNAKDLVIVRTETEKP